MIPAHATDEQIAYWSGRDGHAPIPVVMGGPEEGPDVIPCPCLVGHNALDNTRVVHVAYRLDEIEVAHLARGGTLWLSTWGGLPIHLVEVVPPHSETASRGEAEPGDDVPIGPESRA